MERARRRIDRITDPAFVVGLDQLTVSELRARRDDTREEETRLSYNRRLLQGRLDIVRAEQRRRESGDEMDLIDLLPTILADPPSQRERGGTHSTPVWSPTGDPGRRTDEQLLADASLGQVPDLSDDELTDLVAKLETEERRISELRSTVLRHHDVLQDELVRRYRVEGVTAADIVSDAGSEGPATP